MSLLGVDPGKVNIGYAFYRNNNTWVSGTLVMRDSLPNRLYKLRKWLIKAHSLVTLDIIAVEVLKGGKSWIIYDLACVVSVIACFCAENNVSYVEILPSHHYYTISGKGKPNDVYDAHIRHVLGKNFKTPHEKTAVGCAITVLRDLENRLPDKVRGKLNWLYKKV